MQMHQLEYETMKLTDNLYDYMLLFDAYVNSYISNDPRTKIGARLHRLGELDKSQSIYSTGVAGFNVFPEAYYDKNLQARIFADSEFKHKNMIHAEDLALNIANETNYNNGELGLWVLDVPCENCTEKILDEKITRVTAHLPFVHRHINRSNNSPSKKKERVNKMQKEGVDFRFYPNAIGCMAFIDGTNYIL